jgi:multidrug resistance efflux pump
MDDRRFTSPRRERPKMNETAQPAAGAMAADPPVATEIDVGAAKAPASPMRKVILAALILLLVLFVYHVLSDRYTPYTSQARVETFMTQIAPEVAGDVIEVGVRDNGRVKKGQLLFRIDPEPYELAVRAAEANLSVALQGADVSVADIAAARAQIAKQRADLAASRELRGIVTNLVSKRALATTQGIRARADTAKTEADLSRAQADLQKAEASLGAPGLANPKVRQSLAALEQARLDLRNTRVVAPADGIVTNLRLAMGQYVGPGQPLLSFLERGPRWISADMRENQLGNVKPGQEVTIALDIKPGKLFRGKVDSVGWGVSQGDEAPTGQLSSMPKDQGWLREPQRFPVRIIVLPEQARKAGIDVGRSGAQANVIIFANDGSIMNPIGRLWIRLVALLSYLQ